MRFCSGRCPDTITLNSVSTVLQFTNGHKLRHANTKLINAIVVSDGTSIVVYNKCRRNDLIKTEGVQIRLTKAVSGYFDHKNNHQRYRQFKLEPIWLRCIKLNFVFIYQLRNGISYSSASTPSYSMISSNNLRNKECILAIPRTHTDARICSWFSTQQCGTD